MSRRVYDLLRSLVEHLGGSMRYERAGHRYGAWVIRVADREATIQAVGQHAFPDLDRLHVPAIDNPRRWEDYEHELVPDAEQRLLALLKGASGSNGPSCTESLELRSFIEQTRWKFAWTYARTYPHEYTTRSLCPPEHHSTLIESIERYGITERFGTSMRKYLYFDERKYWHMGTPESDNPDDWRRRHQPHLGGCQAARRECPGTGGRLRRSSSRCAFGRSNWKSPPIAHILIRPMMVLVPQAPTRVTAPHPLGVAPITKQRQRAPPYAF